MQAGNSEDVDSKASHRVETRLLCCEFNLDFVRDFESKAKFRFVTVITWIKANRRRRWRRQRQQKRWWRQQKNDVNNNNDVDSNDDDGDDYDSDKYNNNKNDNNNSDNDPKVSADN